jgi:hypothetical protein
VDAVVDTGWSVAIYICPSCALNAPHRAFPSQQDKDAFLGLALRYHHAAINGA